MHAGVAIAVGSAARLLTYFCSHLGINKHWRISSITDRHVSAVATSSLDASLANVTEPSQPITPLASQFQFFSEQSPVPAYWIRPDQGFRLVYVNDAACRHHGYSAAELLTMAVPDWDPNYSLANCERFWAQLKIQKTIRIETVHRHRGGELIPVEVSTSYILHEGVEYITGHIHEIKHRQQAVANLIKRGSRLSTLVEIQRQLLDLNCDSQSWYEQVVELLGQESTASRVVIFANRRDVDGRLLMSQKAEWHAPQERSVLSELDFQDLPYEDCLPSWPQMLTEGKVITGRVMEFPEPESSMLQSLGIASVLVFPLLVNHEFWGFIGFNHQKIDRDWEISEIDLLRAAAAALSLALERKQVDQTLRESEKRFRLLFESTPNIAVQGYNQKRQVIFWNQASERLYGYARSQALGKQLEDLIIPASQREQVIKNVSAWITVGQEIPPGEIELVRQDGSDVTVYSSHIMLTNVHGETELYCVDVDLTARKQIEAQLQAASLQDHLTGLPNRTFIHNRLDQLLTRYHRTPDYLFAVLFLDLDRFKVINDSLGHTAGDDFLVEVARRLSHILRREDTVSRLGGDEFVILLETVEDISDVLHCAMRIQESLSIPIQLAGTAVTTGVSIGITLAAPRYINAGELLQDADIAMYAAKAAGRGCYQIFDPQMHEDAKARLQKEADLRQALEQEQFRVVYQPIVALSTQQLEGFEALVRWQHPQRGLLPPGEFLAIAEQAGLLSAIDLWVLRTACEQLMQWSRLSYPSAGNLSISVNVSSLMFAQSNLVLAVSEILQQSGLPPRCLKLEITEGVIMENADEALNKLRGLKALGVQLNIDDFGTGYSSLSRLQQFPIDALKIDQCFVRRLGASSESLAIVRAIITLASTLGIEVVAEGIETEQQKQQLQELACEKGQGYLFAAALPVHRAQDLIGKFYPYSMSA
jgi:diguanylate cyclase (GGDEF)-like protein/PAS domain S-box-containing protein